MSFKFQKTYAVHNPLYEYQLHQFKYINYLKIQTFKLNTFKDEKIDFYYLCFCS